MRKCMVVLALLISALATDLSHAQVPSPTPFSERAFVTAIDLVVEVNDAQGRTPSDLQPSDFRVFENRIERKVIGLEYLNPKRPVSATATAAPERAEWQIVIWFDAATMAPPSLILNARELSRLVPDLLEFGPVTLVHSDQSPEALVESTRDEPKLHSAIQTLLKRPTGNRLARARREFLFIRDPLSRYREIPAYIAEEERIIGMARSNLLRWVERMPRKLPRMLIYVGDGFDLDPAEFYIRSGGSDALDPELQSIRTSFGTKTRDATVNMARRLAIGGWTAVVIGGTNMELLEDASQSGFRDARGPGPPFTFLSPAHALIRMAEETGGERITSAAKLSGALRDVSERIRITYQVDREPDPEPRRVDVVSLRKELTVRGPEWVSSTTPEGVAEARAVEALPGRGAAGDLQVDAKLVPSTGQKALPMLEVRVDFSPLHGIAARIGDTKVRFTVAVEIPGSPPAVFSQHVRVENVGEPGLFLWKAPMNLPKKVGAIAVVAEELTSGAWGAGRVARPGR